LISKICLVEDDPIIREIVGQKLSQASYAIESFSHAEALGSDFARFDLFILDVLLEGDKSGLDLCGEIRKGNPEVPILILSALAEPQDRIEGLRLGADDYLAKPFEMEELLLRVRGMLKRRQWYAARPSQGNIFRWEAGEVDFAKRLAQTHRERVGLSQKECMILKLLIEKEGEAVHRDEILDKVWEYHL